MAFYGVTRMSSPEKLAKTIEQLKVIEINTDASAKKKELKQLLQTLTELSCNSHFQSHKEFANYIGPSIDVLIKHYDSKESDIRLASDEGLCRVIKVAELYMIPSLIPDLVSHHSATLFFFSGPHPNLQQQGTC